MLTRDIENGDPVEATDGLTNILLIGSMQNRDGVYKLEHI